MAGVLQIIGPLALRAGGKAGRLDGLTLWQREALRCEERSIREERTHTIGKVAACLAPEWQHQGHLLIEKHRRRQIEEQAAVKIPFETFGEIAFGHEAEKVCDRMKLASRGRSVRSKP